MMMNSRPPIKSTIDSYRKKRQQIIPLIIGIAAILLVIIGIVVIVLAFTGPGRGFTLFGPRSPGASITPIITNTGPPTEIPTITLTPTETPTFTPSAPFVYEVQEGDSLDSIAKKFDLGDNGVLLLLYLNPLIDPGTQIIFVGMKILVPPPNYPLPTTTPISLDLPRGTKINYYVQYGDSLASIALKFNSTVDAILKENNIDDPNTIFVGQLLVIPVNLVTPAPTSTSETITATSTSTSTSTATP